MSNYSLPATIHRHLRENASISLSHSRTEKIPHEVVLLTLAFIFLLDVTGNLIVVIVIFLERRMKTFTNWMILNLAVADLTVALFCIPLEVPLELSDEWLYGKMFCKLFYPLQSSTIYASVFTLVVTSCSRYYAISHPFCRQPTALHAKRFMCGIWICSLMFMIPLMVTLQVNEDTCECVETWSNANRRWFTVMTFVFQYVLPVLIIVTAYSLTVYEMRPRKLLAATEEERKKRKENKKVTTLVFVVTGTFAVCVLPYHILGLFAEFGDARSYHHIDDLFYISYFLLYLNSAMNPILYNFFSSSFREAFARLRRRLGTKCTDIHDDIDSSMHMFVRSEHIPFNRPSRCESRFESYRSGRTSKTESHELYAL